MRATGLWRAHKTRLERAAAVTQHGMARRSSDSSMEEIRQRVAWRAARQAWLSSNNIALASSAISATLFPHISRIITCCSVL